MAFKILTYKGKLLSEATPEELRAVIDDMGDVYRRRLAGLRSSVDNLYKSANELVKATISLEVEKYSESIKTGVKKLCADLSLDAEPEGD